MTRFGITDPLVGDVLGGRYEILEKRARGGMATVYRAFDSRLGRVVAVKIMHEGLGDDASFARKFDREARAAARLSDPHVVGVFDQGRDHGRPYIVMEYVDGYTLRNLITREAPFNPLRALILIEPVVAALAAAHGAGFVHRDVKPENVLISNKGQLKLSDFGLARAVTNETATATQGLVIGTVSYIPPELVTSGDADARSDVYSVGVVLFEMLTGRKPYTGETPLQVAYCHVNNDMPCPSEVLREAGRGSVPNYLDALVSACTRRDPAQRPRDARELLERLRRARCALASGVLADESLCAVMNPPAFRAVTASKVSYGVVHTVSDSAATTILPSSSVPSTRTATTTTTRLRKSAPTDQPALDYEWAPIPVHQPASSGRGPEEPVRPISPVDLNDDSAKLPALSPTDGLTGRSEASPCSLRTPLFPELAHDRIHRRRRGIVGLIMVLLITLIVGLSSWWFAAGRFVAAPDVINQTQDQAVQTARSAGLTISFSSGYSEDIAKDHVISSSPVPGQRVNRNGTMHALLSLGPERYAVPALLGLTQVEATAALAKVNLVVGQVGEAYDEQAAAGTIVKTSIDAGQLVKKGTSVDWVLSKGPAPVGVKDFTNASAADAESALKKAGFAVSSSQQPSDSVQQGLVISQNPRSGTAPRGATITLVVSSGPPVAQVPDVRGKSPDAANTALTQAGFHVTTVFLSDPRMRMNLVIGSVPDATNKAVVGSTITIYIL